MGNAAKAPIQPPAHVTLSDAALRYWPGIVRARARDEWTEADLVVGVHFAQCQADIEAESELLATEGTVHGGRINPRAAVVDLLIRRQMALMRTLRMGGRGAGDARDLHGRRRIERQARQARAEVEDDDLLAR